MKVHYMNHRVWNHMIRCINGNITPADWEHILSKARHIYVNCSMVNSSIAQLQMFANSSYMQSHAAASLCKKNMQIFHQSESNIAIYSGNRSRRSHSPNTEATNYLPYTEAETVNMKPFRMTRNKSTCVDRTDDIVNTSFSSNLIPPSSIDYLTVDRTLSIHQLFESASNLYLSHYLSNSKSNTPNSPSFCSDHKKCQCCNLPLIDSELQARPKLDARLTKPFFIGYGILMFKFKLCSGHFSVWGTRRGKYKYFCFQGRKGFHLAQHCFRSALNGEPGKHTCKDGCFSSVNAFNNVVCANGTPGPSGGTAKRRMSRRAYREWKTSQREYSTRVSAVFSRPPLRLVTCPKVLVPNDVPFFSSSSKLTLEQFSMSNRSYVHTTRKANVFRSFVDPKNNSRLKLSMPKLYPWKFATLNVEDLRSTIKYKRIQQFFQEYEIDVLAIQETHTAHNDYYCKDGLHYFLMGSPIDTHAGVGFVVSPRIMPFVYKFNPISTRIASINVRTTGKEIVLFSVYAPSLLSKTHTHEEDKDRKQEFWDQLSFSMPDARFFTTIILGDLNMRCHSEIPEMQHIVGPYLFGYKPLQDPVYSTNLEFFIGFAETFDMYLPGTFQTKHPSQRITYREIAASEFADTRFPSPTDFAVLDHVVLPVDCKRCSPDVTSMSSFAFPSHHYPVIFKMEYAKRLPVFNHKTASVPKYLVPNKDQKLLFVEAVHTKIGLSIRQGPDDDNYTAIYTDGSFDPSSPLTAASPGGWGFCVEVEENSWIDSYGMLVLDPDNPAAIGVGDITNNTAEIQAVIEALDYILRGPANSSYVIFVDSQYTLDLIASLSRPSTHLNLVLKLQSMVRAVRTRQPVNFRKIAAHTGIVGNERADMMAARGRLGFDPPHTGRFATIPPQPLTPVTDFQVPQWFKDASFNEQYKFLKDLFSLAKDFFPTTQLRAADFVISEETSKTYDAFSAIKYDSFSATKLKKRLLSTFRKLIKKDKKMYLSDKLLADSKSGPRQKWTTIKHIRKTYTPSAPNVRALSGQVSSPETRSVFLAQYFSQDVWSGDNPDIPTTDPLHDVAIGFMTPFELWELYFRLNNCKNHKVGGTDGLLAEFFKYAPQEALQLLLHFFNNCFISTTIPTEWYHSRLAAIPKPKTKDPLSVASFRPICLSQTCYKLYAGMLKGRLEGCIEDRIRNFQFGFRRNRSTSQPIHVIRRIIELFERSTDALHLLFLDWRKAFDSVFRSAIASSLLRLGVPEPLLNAVMSLYVESTFEICDKFGTTVSYTQSRGIRQGCPISPYIFNIVLTVLLHDVEQDYIRINGTSPWVYSANQPLWDVEYADDTVLITRSASSLQEILNLLIPRALTIGLELNAGKCEHLPMHSDETVYYCSGQENIPFHKVSAAKYLGVYLDSSSSSAREISHRLQQAGNAFRLLGPFFRHSGISTKWRLQVHRQVLISILTYSLHSASLDEISIKRLDSFHFKVLRSISGAKHTYFSKMLSTSSPVVTMQDLHSKHHAISKSCIPPSQLIAAQRMGLFGHVLRHPESIQYTCCLREMGNPRSLSTTLRKGAPRLHWAEMCYVEAYRKLKLFENFRLPSKLPLSHVFHSSVNKSEVNDLLGGDTLYRPNLAGVTRYVISKAQDRNVWKLISRPPE